MAKKPHTVEFYECEHEGDLDIYCDDLRASGANIGETSINADAEIGKVTFTVEGDWSKFVTAFKKTESFDFLN